MENDESELILSDVLHANITVLVWLIPDQAMKAGSSEDAENVKNAVIDLRLFKKLKKGL